jgi:curved DNA-binding protein CbpA
MTRLPGPGPFAALGLPARTDLTDDEVRAAWRRVATATHPDRADGGDRARFAAAAAAYTALRTRSGRGEALAGLAEPATRAGRGGPGPASRGAGRASSPRPGDRAAARLGLIPGSLIRLPARARGGRPAVLLARLAATAAMAALVVITTGWGPATAAVITGAVTWLVLTARHDLAPPP